MEISRLNIENFRGIKSAEIFLSKHSVLIGDNNTGKTTTLEAIDLVLGPERLNRYPPIDEHDFYLSQYLTDSHDQEGEHAEPVTPPTIKIEVVITDLTDEQKSRFIEHIEFWDSYVNCFYEAPNPEGVDASHIKDAVRICFVGNYNEEEDDFEGNTYFSRSYENDTRPTVFRKQDKRLCGFLYLRSIRTASRALSLERGSLLDIILRLKELRPQMWESTISDLKDIDVASAPELGITGVLQSVNKALNNYVPKEWGTEPQLKVSNLTREHLRKFITAFIATGSGKHTAPFYRQGTGTINMLVLAMLSLIAEEKQNVIFAMEEPETAIPPYAQKRIVHELLKLTSQTIFTSHSPYVLEEFNVDDIVVLSRDDNHVVTRHYIELPKGIKPKQFYLNFRTRFCEGLLSRRVMLAEGATEADSISALFKYLESLDPQQYSSLEAMGICTIDAGTESQLKALGLLFTSLGKDVYVFCDKQTEDQEKAISSVVKALFMHQEKGFENLVLRNTTDEALSRYAQSIEWPSHIIQKYPDIDANLYDALFEYFKNKKAEHAIADFLIQCNEEEIPEWLKESCVELKKLIEKTEDNGEDKPADEPESVLSFL